MQLSRWLAHLATRALASSMDVHAMVNMARRLIRNYDIHQRTGFPGNFAVPKMDAATQIIRDMERHDLLLDFISLLINLQDGGILGVTYRIPHLREIMREINSLGLLYDEETGMFLEDPRIRRTKNWGVLRENEEYIFTFLAADIVESTALVRRYPEQVVSSTYRDLRDLLQSVVDNRNGRIWNWEGDGGVAAFYFTNKNNNAVLSAMEIINEIYLYNLIHCRLDQPLEIRMAVHNGPCEYRSHFGELQNDTLKKLEEIEKNHTQPNSVTVSSSVHHMLSQLLAEQMTSVRHSSANTYYRFKLEWDG